MTFPVLWIFNQIFPFKIYFAFLKKMFKVFEVFEFVCACIFWGRSFYNSIKNFEEKTYCIFYWKKFFRFGFTICINQKKLILYTLQMHLQSCLNLFFSSRNFVVLLQASEYVEEMVKWWYASKFNICIYTYTLSTKIK